MPRVANTALWTIVLLGGTIKLMSTLGAEEHDIQAAKIAIERDKQLYRSGGVQMDEQEDRRWSNPPPHHSI
jgi:hypothetical protein